MKIKIVELNEILNRVLKKAIDDGINDVEITNDYYWEITSPDRENFNDANPNVSVGSLEDDYSELQKILRKNNIPTINDFNRSANILIAVGEEISSSEKIY